MTEEQEQALTEKMSRIGYSAFEVLPGEDAILMVHVSDHLICSVSYAMSLPDEQLKALVDETVQAPGD